MAGGTTGDRMRSIRELRGEKQPEFATELTRAAKRLRLDVTYEGSKVSRLESGRQIFTLEDVTIVASVDPEKRGREWLAWGEDGPILLDPRKDRGLTAEEEQRAVSKAAALQAKPQGKGTRKKA
jgi:transcriptional regulator with XRE-family HTH domain